MSVMSTEEICPKFEVAFSIIGKKWVGLIVASLLDGPKRFRDIAVLLPKLSDRMLAVRLKELEEMGLITKEPCDSEACSYYELTDMGKELEDVMREIQEWALAWL